MNQSGKNNILKYNKIKKKGEKNEQFKTKKSSSYVRSRIS